MAKFLLSAHVVDGQSREPMTRERMEAMMASIGALEAEMNAANALTMSGRLTEPAAATVVRPSRGKVRRTDGPFAESKEHLGGFYVIEAADLEAAVGWATKTALAVDAPIEVRAFAEMPRG